MTRRLLLVTPSFHGYWRSIERAFASLGYDVRTHCYDHAVKAEKIYNKLRYELPARVRGERRHLSDELVTRRAVERLRAWRPTHVLVVRGDALTAEFWAEAEAIGAARLLWLYDELRRMRHDIDTVAKVAAVASYSAGDVADLRRRGIDATYVPLAFDPDITLPSPTPRAELTFIGARFPRREALLRPLHDAQLPLRCFGRDWSNHPVDRLRTFRVRRGEIPAGRDQSLPKAWAIMRDSLATLNIHGDQDGFTMRTFEASGVGAVQLIDRPDVSECFEPGLEVLTFADGEELLDRARAVVAHPREFDGLRKRARARALAEHTFAHRARVLDQLWR